MRTVSARQCIRTEIERIRTDFKCIRTEIKRIRTEIIRIRAESEGSSLIRFVK